MMMRTGIDHDPVIPWNWASLIGQNDPVEIVSYPIPNLGKIPTIMVRLKVGDPTSIKEVPMKAIAAFAPNWHEWDLRPKIYSEMNPSSFYFVDELPEGAICKACKKLQSDCKCDSNKETQAV